jgi:hypothetical protein
VQPPKARGRSKYKQPSQIGIALFRDPAEPVLAAAKVLSRNKAEPGHKVAAGGKGRWIRHMAGEGRADQGADARDGLQSLRRCSTATRLRSARRSSQMRLNRAELIGEDSHDRESGLRNVRDVRIVFVKATREVGEVLDARFSMTPNSAT